MMREVEVAVVGAGPAGIAAALAADTAGCDVVLIDKAAEPGGQVFRTRHGSLFDDGPTAADGRRVLDKLDRARSVQFLGDTVTWDASLDKELTLYSDGAISQIRPKAIVLAPGAYERTVPFDGWTIPGVMTLGAIQRILHDSERLPGKRFVLAGTGPLLYLLAHMLSGHGATVACVLDVQPALAAARRGAAAFWRQVDLLAHGARIGLTLVRFGIPVRFGWTITGVSGADRVEQVTIGPVRGSGREAIRIDADTVGIGFGFLPRFELAALLGGTVCYNDPQNGFEVRPVREDSAAVADGVFLAGDGSAVGGYRLSLAGGWAAGAEAAAAATGRVVPDRAVGMHRRARKAQRAIDRLYQLPDEIWRMPQIAAICRCEGVTRGDVERAIHSGAANIGEIRLRTRAGMGACQGRNCRGNIAAMLRQSGQKVQIQAPTVRPPVEPLPIQPLANTDIEIADPDPASQPRKECYCADHGNWRTGSASNSS